MRFGISIPQILSSEGFDPTMLKDFLGRAEAWGFQSAWVMERVVGNPPVLDPLVLLSYAAASTSKIKLGSSILMAVMRNPIIMAKSLASIDHLAEGRLIVGIGFGGFTQSPHYPAFGISPKSAGSRFEEGVQIMKKVWTEEKVNFQGRFWQIDNMVVTPKPLQKPHPPIWFGAHSPTAIKRAVRMGDAWMGSSIPSTKKFIEELDLVKRYLDEAGRDPKSFGISKRVYIAVDKDKKRALEKMREWFDKMYGDADMASQTAIMGGPEECLEQLAQLGSLGVDLVMTDLVYDEREQAEVLAQEIIPKL